MAKPMKALRTAMFAADVKQEDIATAIGRSVQYVSDRMVNKRSFTITECYQIIELLGEGPKSIFELFPPEQPRRRTAWKNI